MPKTWFELRNEALDLHLEQNRINYWRKTLGPKLVAALIVRHGSLRGAARACGIAAPNLHNISTGKRLASAELLGKLARKL